MNPELNGSHNSAMSRRALLVAMGGIAAGAGLTIANPTGVAMAAPLANNWLGFIMSGPNGLVMDVAWASNDEGAELIQWPLHGGTNQIFRFESQGAGRYRIVATHSGKVLTVAGGATTDGAPVVQATWTGAANQIFVEPNYGWQPHPLIRPLHNRSAKALQPADNSAAVGARIVQWDESPRTSTQRWRWRSAAMTAGHSGLVAYSPSRGRQLVQVDFGQRSGALAQQLYRIEGIAGGGNGFYRIVSSGDDDLVVAVPGGAMNDGAPIVTERWAGTSGQLWKIEPVEGRPGLHRVVNAHSGKVMDVAGVSTTGGALIHQWTWLGGVNQLWRL